MNIVVNLMLYSHLLFHLFLFLYTVHRLSKQDVFLSSCILDIFCTFFFSIWKKYTAAWRVLKFEHIQVCSKAHFIKIICKIIKVLKTVEISYGKIAFGPKPSTSHLWLVGMCQNKLWLLGHNVFQNFICDLKNHSASPFQGQSFVLTSFYRKFWVYNA